MPADRCGVWWVRTFHLYWGFRHKISYIRQFIKISVRKTKPNNWLKKKSKIRAIIVRTKYGYSRCDSTKIKFWINSCVLLKKRMTPRGKTLFGPIIYNMKRKKFIFSFPAII
jgi:large subunit ribosomal protein L14